MENLVMERVKLMGSTAPRKGSDPIKPDHRPTYRFTLELLLSILKLKPFQTLDGKFGDGKSEAQGKYSANEGVRPSQARPRQPETSQKRQTNRVTGFCMSENVFTMFTMSLQSLKNLK